MVWDAEQIVILEKLREAYNKRQRSYTRIRADEGEFLLIHGGSPGAPNTERLKLGSGDYVALVDSAVLRETASQMRGTISANVLIWDAPPAPPVASISVSGHGNAFLIQHGAGNDASGANIIGGTVVTGELGELRQQLAELLAASNDAAAADVGKLVDEAIISARRSGRSIVTDTLIVGAIDLVAKVTSIGSNGVTIIKAIGAFLEAATPT